MDISKAILSLGQYEFVIQGEIKSEQDWNENVKFVSGADENGTAIFLETKPITYAEVLAEQQRLQTQYDNNQYQRDRANDYPPIEEQLDMQYWDKINGTNNWETMIAEIKARYPK
jgi:hypothetical protein